VIPVNDAKEIIITTTTIFSQYKVYHDRFIMVFLRTSRHMLG
jgi:hypothetical protein